VILDKLSSIIYSFLIIALPLSYIAYMVHVVAKLHFLLSFFCAFACLVFLEEYSS
jgi:hypothetical protein